MKKSIISFLLILHTALLFGNDIELEKAREKYKSHYAISYTATAHYPNPETEEVSTASTFYILNNYNNKNIEFYSLKANVEEIYKNGDYVEVNNEEKAIYKFEKKQGQINSIQNSRLVQYGPTYLFKYKWKYENEVLLEKETLTHYSFLEDTHTYEGKIVKAEFHIYISSENIITKFERKSYVDDKLGQTVTFEFSNYTFSKGRINFKSTPPQNYALKYYERSEIQPLKKGTKAPMFKSVDINQVQFSSKNFIGNKTLLLFSATDCGKCKEVFNFMNNDKFELLPAYKFINAYASNKEEIIRKYFKNNKITFPIIANQKELESKYQISGYPMMYLIDEKGKIAEIYDGSTQIIEFLKSTLKK